MPLLVELCSLCDEPTMFPVETIYEPYRGEPIACVVCRPCYVLMRSGDRRMVERLELRLLARRLLA
jgi:hypothetical protein